METLNINNLHDVHKEEITELCRKMEKCYYFSESFTSDFIKKIIIEQKYTWEEFQQHFWNYYKWMPLAWGIKRVHYHSDKDMYKWHISNYNYPYNEKLFNIYVNTYNLFDCEYHTWLEDLSARIWVFFYDKLNTTFYVLDFWIEGFLDALVEWYEEAKKIMKEKKETELKEFYQRELEKLNKE